MHPTNCLNCETLLTADDHFCPICGQRTDTHRLTIGHIIHEFLHAFTHADKGFLGMVADLAVKPGLVAREYVAGKRKKYFSPFTFFLLSVGIIVFSAHYFGATNREVKADPRIVAQLPEPAKKKYFGLIERTNEAVEFMNKHLNTMNMVAVPLYALLGWIFFGRRGKNYSEILLCYLLFQSFIALFLAVVLTPWLKYLTSPQTLLYVAIAVFVSISLYAGFALYQFFTFKTRLMMLATSSVVLLGYVLFFITTVLAMFYYVYRSHTGEVLKVMWQKYII